MASADVVAQTRSLFVKYVGEFLNALGEKFPTCVGVQGMRVTYGVGIEHAAASDRISVETDLVSTYHRTMTPFYERVASRDDSVFVDAQKTVEFVRKLQIATKWSEADADTRECIYEYLDLLNRFSRMYSVYATVPSNMMTKITSVATKMAAELETGKLTPATIDIAAVGQSVVAGIDERELQQFARTMLSNKEQMQGMLRMVSAMQGGGALGMVAALQQN